MKETTKIFIVVVSAVIMSILGLMVKGVFGAVMGFLFTLLIIGLFNIWRKMNS